MKIIDNIKNYYEINIKDKYVYILNFCEIINISSEVISIKLFDKTVNVRGSSLIICSLDEKELLINGDIKGIDLLE